MTDALVTDVCDSILFMRTMQRGHKGWLIRHMREHGLKSLEACGHRFRLVLVSGNPWHGLEVDLRIEKIREAKAA